MSDFFRINTNLLSLRTRSTLSLTDRRLFRTLQRVTSGKRINRAEDDAAGFSIAAKLNARIRGLEQSLQNTSDAKSMFDVAENSLVQINDILFDIKKRVLQAASAVAGTEERTLIRRQINGYALEINSIVEQATFNDIALLDGTLDSQFQVGERQSDILRIAIDEDLTAQDVQVLEVSSEGVLTSSGSVTAGSTINVFDQFAGVQAGDEIGITLTQGDGTVVNVSLTAAGSKGSATTTTVQDVINTINGTGLFSATFDGASDAIDVTESVPTPGNALAVSFGITSEAPGTDGATGTVPFTFNTSTGNLETAFTSSGAISGATQLNSLDQFDQLEGQDQLTIALTDRDGATQNVNITLAGAAATPSNATINDLVTAINAQAGSQFTATVNGAGQIEIADDALSQFNLNATSSFTENSLDAGAASVSSVSFTQTPQTVGSDTLSGLAAGDRLADTTLGANFDINDSFDVNLTANDGTIETYTFTFATGNDTVQDLINGINANTNFNASLSGGRLLISEDALSAGTQLNAGFSNYVDNAGGDGSFNPESFSVTGDLLLTSFGDLTPNPVTATTLLNDLSQFSNVQSGDQLTINATLDDGTAESFTFTFTGPASGTSTSTVQDLANAINGNMSLTATFDASLGAIRLEDGTSSGTSISLSFSNAGFTEDIKDDAVTLTPPFTFSYNGSALESAQLTSGGVAAGSGTRLNDLDGFANLEGGDQFRITITNRAGSSSNVDITLNDVGAGTTSNATVGDIVSAIDGAVVNGVTMRASLSGGRIEITEENPPNVGSLGGSSSFTENNIDITPKSLSTVTFQISDFLRVSDDTGLVIGLNLLDFDAGNQLTQRVAQVMIENVDDSINRISSVLNQLGTFQLRLSNRELALSQSIIKNEAVASRIEDADMAREYSELAILQIKRQYQIVALAQANLAPINVLDLL